MNVDLEGTDLVQAKPSDWRMVADITAEAFDEDPVNRHVFGGSSSIRSMFRVLTRRMILPLGQGYLHPRGGAAMWMPTGADTAPSRTCLARFAVGQLWQGTPGAIRRAMAVADLMQAWHPKEPHHYLFTIGTTKDARGKGVGKALLAPVLAACDRAGMPVYLENSNPANTGFYRAHRFERLGLFHIDGAGSPVMEPMWRNPPAR